MEDRTAHLFEQSIVDSGVGGRRRGKDLEAVADDPVGLQRDARQMIQCR